MSDDHPDLEQLADEDDARMDAERDHGRFPEPPEDVEAATDEDILRIIGLDPENMDVRYKYLHDPPFHAAVKRCWQMNAAITALTQQLDEARGELQALDDFAARSMTPDHYERYLAALARAATQGGDE